MNDILSDLEPLAADYFYNHSGDKQKAKEVLEACNVALGEIPKRLAREAGDAAQQQADAPRLLSAAVDSLGVQTTVHGIMIAVIVTLMDFLNEG